MSDLLSCKLSLRLFEIDVFYLCGMLVWCQNLVQYFLLSNCEPTIACVASVACVCNWVLAIYCAYFLPLQLVASHLAARIG